ncbi:MAG: hypothetical protein AAF125_00035 [Chloroflexota bacterium]
MTPHLVAVETYGSSRVKSRTGQTVSAQKIGHTTCGRDMLLALYGSNAVDVTSKQASYHYVQITGETAVHSGTLLLALSDDELATVEDITRTHPSERSGCWRWLDNPGRTNNGWHRFPTAVQSDYQPSKYNEGPRYNPTGYRAVSPSGATSSAVPAIRAERTQRSASDTPWWWITGDTYPHRAVFKAAGCRWSRKRKSWYFVGETLHKTVQEIIDMAAFDAKVEAAQPKPEQPIGTGAGGKFKVGDCVQAADDFMALGGGTIKAGTLGIVKQCFGEAGELGYSYTVDFAVSGETWCFEMDLAPAPDMPPPPAAPQTLAESPVVETPPAEPIVAQAKSTPSPAEETPLPTAEPTKPENVPGVHYPRFTVGQTVYTNAQIKLNTAGAIIHQGVEGTIVRRFDIRQTDKYESFGYTVTFEDGGTHLLFERTLDDERPPSYRHIRNEEPIMLIPGLSGQSLLAAHIARREAIVNGTDWDDSTIDESPDTVQPTEAAESAPAAELEPNITPDDKPIADEDEGESAIRVLKPETLPDHLQTAVEAARGKSVTVSAPKSNSTRTPIQQAYVGELTGAITGNVYCYGYAVHQGVLLYLSFGGPRTAVEAIRAKLAKGEVVNLVPWDAPAIELSAGETDGAVNTGMFTTYLHSISEAKFTSAILVHEWLTDPNYGGKSVTGIFRTDDTQAVAKLTDHVRKLVKVPVFDDWRGFLLSAGESAGLVRSPRSGGGIDLLVLEMDVDAWSRLITGGLANGVIALPEQHVE